MHSVSLLIFADLWPFCRPAHFCSLPILLMIGKSYRTLAQTVARCRHFLFMNRMGKGKKRLVLFVNILVANRIRRMEFLYRHTRNGMLQRFHSSFFLKIAEHSSGKELAKPYTITIPWTHSPVASKLEVALKGNPPPTSSLRTLTLFALLGVVRLGPFRAALSTLNEIT